MYLGSVKPSSLCRLTIEKIIDRYSRSTVGIYRAASFLEITARQPHSHSHLIFVNKQVHSVKNCQGKGSEGAG